MWQIRSHRKWSSCGVVGALVALATALSGSVATAESQQSPILMQPDAVLGPAVTMRSDTSFASANFAAYKTEDSDAANEAKPAASEAGDSCRCGPSCSCGSNMNSWCCCPIMASDHCYDCFISPMTNPVFFEDPRNVSEARAIFLNHGVPNSAKGGDIQLLALQIRARLTDRLSLIATKDGYIFSDNPLIRDGWADVSAGLKYLLYSDPSEQVLVSTGAVYEMPVGSTRSQQANGDGTFDLFLTGGALLCNNVHWIGAGGFVLPVDNNDNSTWCYVSNHFDYYMGRGWYVLNEYNWYHYLQSGNNIGLNIEGGDLFNFGSNNVAGNDIVTGAFGVKYKPNECTEIGIAYELPLTDREDVFNNRLTVDYIVRF